LNPQTQFIVPALSSHFGAILAAMGIATWLEQLGHDVTGDHIDIQIADRGDAIVITTPAALTPQQVQANHYVRPPRWIRTAKNGATPARLSEIDYEAERQHNADYYARLEAYRKAGVSINKLDDDQRNELEQMAPRSYWPVVAVINQMGALGAYNKAVERWAACREVYPDLVGIIWTMCSGEPRALEAAQTQWETLAKKHGLEKSPLLSAPQVVNPEQGKGANRAKADKLDIGGQESFWLLEYFKFAGLYHAALPRTVQGKKDRKTYVVLPARDGIALRWHHDLFAQFQQQFWSTSAIKMDVQAVLRYTATMLAQWQAAQSSRGRRRRISDFVEGFIVASFKDLGSAVAVMNVATLRLPDWVEWPTYPQQARQFGEVIEEHQRLTGVLDEKKGEEEQLLRDYRNFLSSRDPSLHAFFDFTTAYAGHTIRKMSKREPVRRFTLNNLEVIIMANDERRKEAGMPPLSNIVQTQGFRNIATAIRRSTVIPQLQKVKGDTPYDVRYGLADELRRKARHKGEFIVALSEFMQQYNQENKRVFAREKRPVRADITTQDITDIVRLIDEYDSPTVANLLIAFGYARDPKATGEDSTSLETTNQGGLPAQDDSELPHE
jgi:hypothetical protein